MLPASLKRTLAGFSARARGFAHDRKGAAMIEFAELTPVLLIMLLGSIEVSRAVGMDRRFGMVTAMTGDLITRESTTSDTELAAMMDIVAFLMQPYDSSSLKARIISVKANPTNASDTKIDWTYSYGGITVPTRCSAYTLPTGLVAAGGSVVVVETQYSYSPLFLSWTGNHMQASTWTDKSTHSPRQSSCVDKIGNNCVSDCFS